MHLAEALLEVRRLQLLLDARDPPLLVRDVRLQRAQLRGERPRAVDLRLGFGQARLGCGLCCEWGEVENVGRGRDVRCGL